VSDVAAACERAAGFVTTHGDAVARARAEALIGRSPAQQALAALGEGGAEGPLESVRRLLGICDDLGLLHTPPVERACAHLAKCQADDGSWVEPSVASPEEAIRMTGMLGGYLAKTRFVRPESLGAASDFLAAHWSPERVQGFRWHDLAAYAHTFANVDHEDSDAILQWCGRELERGFRARAFDAVRTARVLVYCDAHALPGARLDARELVVALVSEQVDDGSWPAPDAASTEQRVERALDGLVALRRLGGRAPRAPGGSPRSAAR